MLVKNKRSKRHILHVWVLSAMVIPFALFIYHSLSVSSLQIQDRSVRLSTSAPGAAAQHTYRFTIPSSNVIGSIAIEYCTNSPLEIFVCVSPTGIDATGASIVSQTTNTGFSVSAVDTTTNRLVLTRAPAAGVIGLTEYVINPIVSPPNSNETVFVRVSTHASTDGTGPAVDMGAMAFSTGIAAFGVGAFVPPYLTFCVGQTVAINCSTTGNLLANFGEMTPSSPVTATIQFSAATNDFSGYNIYMSGQTLTSGNAIIPALATASISSVGTSQFGANLRSNTNPFVGADRQGPGSAAVDNNYNSPNFFRYVSGDRIAYANTSTDFSRFTVSYITNVSEDQPPGIYATTLTYTAVASF